MVNLQSNPIIHSGDSASHPTANSETTSMPGELKIQFTVLVFLAFPALSLEKIEQLAPVVVSEWWCTKSNGHKKIYSSKFNEHEVAERARKT